MVTDTAIQTAKRDLRRIRLPAAVEALIGARTADAVFVVDPGHRVVHWDARAESLTGLMAEEVVGRPCHEVLSGERGGGGPLCDYERSVMRLARAGVAPPACDLHVSTRWGQRRWVNVSVLSVESDDGPYLVHLMRDVQRTYETLEMACGLLRVSAGRERAPAHRDAPELSPRQMEVLRLLAEGKSVKEICAALFLSQATVRNHVRSILQALGAHSQLEALAKARKIGLLSD